MRATSVLRVLLALHKTRVVGYEFDDDGLVIDVAPTYRRARCSGCERVCSVYDGRLRTWRHLDLGGIATRLRYFLRRVSCPRCGVLVEDVPWAEAGSGETLPFEEHVACLAQRTDRTTVTNFMRIAWRTVGRIIARVVARHDARRGMDRLHGLRIIGIDELSYRRHHQYITVVINHETSEVVWAAEGKSAETLKAFFDALGPARCAQLEAVTIDMSAAYIKAVTEASPQALLVFDRFHVQRLAHDAVDEVRRDEVRKAAADDKSALKHTRWALQKNPWNLRRFERDKLATLQRANRPLYRAYLLKETLVGILDRRQVGVAQSKLDEWLAWARRSRLDPFVKLATTIDKYRHGILAYVRTRLNNGRTEGLNGKARTITRRAFGFHSAASLIAMLFLCCGNIHLQPAHIFPFWTH